MRAVRLPASGGPDRPVLDELPAPTPTPSLPLPELPTVPDRAPAASGDSPAGRWTGWPRAPVGPW